MASRQLSLQPNLQLVSHSSTVPHHNNLLTSNSHLHHNSQAMGNPTSNMDNNLLSNRRNNTDSHSINNMVNSSRSNNPRNNSSTINLPLLTTSTPISRVIMVRHLGMKTEM